MNKKKAIIAVAAAWYLFHVLTLPPKPMRYVQVNNYQIPIYSDRDVNNELRKYYDTTLLIDEIRANDIDEVKRLIAAGFDVNERSERGRRTPLHAAAAVNVPELIGLLVANGAELEAVDRDGMTPLGIAADSKNIAMMQALLQAGADPNGGSGNGILESTPL
ncbi:MAG: ankyrin repeat domain-containing protein, partial [Planctomycetota bacterium]|nr:ankyrin repeat domain-containing protein [Planctomycetota bacterium]